MKNGHSEDDTFSQPKILRVIFVMKLLPWNWLKWRGKSVPRETCSYFSHPLDVYEASPGQQSPWTSTHYRSSSDYPNFMTCFYFSLALDQIASTVK